MQALGHISLHMIAAGLTGYMATVANLKDPVHKWRCAAAPLTVSKISTYVSLLSLQILFLTSIKAWS
jgi:hypothetical protein